MSSFPAEFDNVEVNFFDAKQEPAKSEVQELGFKNHGLVIRDAGGTAIWSQPDHDVNVDDVRNKLYELSGKPKTDG